MSRAALDALLSHRIVILDGAMGTLIQSQGFQELPDLLVLERPDVVGDLHTAYLDAGADIIRTNTFSSAALGEVDRHSPSLVYDVTLAGARLARAAVDASQRKTPGRQRFVAGGLGPTTDRAAGAYGAQVRCLLDGGVDLLLLETIFDVTNAQTAIDAIARELDGRGVDVPLMISATSTGRSRTTIGGRRPTAFYASLRNVRLFSVGLNCCFGVASMRPLLTELSRRTDAYLSCHPNAGLPNAKGGYDESPSQMADGIRALAADHLLNIAGGCCGTTPDHIRAIAEALRDVRPRGVAA